MISRRFSKRPRTPSPCSGEILEKRTLLAAVSGSISFDGQAPKVVGSVNTTDILAVSDGDSTRIYASSGTQQLTGQITNSALPISEITYAQAIRPDPNLEGVDTILFFAGRNGVHTDLYATDGSPGSVVLVKSRISLYPASTNNFAVLNDELYFGAESDNLTVGNELYKSNGGPAELVADLRPGMRPQTLQLQPDRGIEF